MFGFNIIKGGKGSINCKSSLVYKDVIFESNLIEKFENDKLFFENDQYMIVLDGVVLNKKEIQGDMTWKEAFVTLYRNNGDTFFSVMRGSFSGAIYDKLLDKLIVFSDQLGTKFLYYVNEGNRFICSSMMSQMYSLLKINNIKYDLSEQGALCLLTYGFMLENLTICDKVFKIIPGDYLLFHESKLKTFSYYKIKKNVNQALTQEEAIEHMDATFRNAVKRQFHKDKEYGYRHLVALSAGFDSRMTSWVAHEMGYTDQVNLTFSQTNYWDEVVPKQIASDLQHEWIFKSLDNGLWLKNIDQVTETTGGNIIYYGSAHSYSILQYLNFEKLGLMHSGQIGDGINGSYLTQNSNGKFKLGLWASNVDYIDKLNIELPDYQDAEIGVIYTRALNGVINGQQLLYNFTETLSPFLDLDFVEACFNMPLSLRENHHLYNKWVISKYPKAADYVWESIGCKITDPAFHIGDRYIPVKMIIPKILNRLRFKKSIDSLNHMNPLGYYLNTNTELRDIIMSYFKYKELISSKTVYRIIEEFEKHGSSVQILQAATLLSALKLFYSEKV